ncbi:MAG: hypothetical protein SNI51_08105 [Rikenellaceae bacterium]
METNLGRVVGQSAYELAVEGGYEGTQEEWLQSLAADSDCYTKDEVDAMFEAVDETIGDIETILESINGE